MRTKTRHTATRHGPGDYTYRGFNILKDISATYGNTWFIAPYDPEIGGADLDPVYTLQEARSAIDAWFGPEDEYPFN